MKSFKKLTIILVATVVVLVFFLLFRYFANKTEVTNDIRDYQEIISSDTIIAVVSTNPIDYFIYQGRPMGFQLEILQEFAKYNNLSLKIIVENNLLKGVDLLMDRKCDVLAQSIVVSAERDLVYEFTIPVRETRLVLVQRKPQEYFQLSYNELEDTLVRTIDELDGKTIFAYKGSISKTVLQNLSQEIAENFYIADIDSISPEQIIYYVANGRFDYAICDESIAKVAQSYYPNIDIKTELSLPQNIAWGIRPESVVLLDSINNWLEEFKKTPDYNKFCLRYINNNRILVDINSEFYSGNEGKISNYDNLIKKYSHIAGWDWRLISSLIYEESRFNESVTSWAGAYGLMQLMPFIYSKFAPDSVSGVEAHIAAGANYIAFLETKIPENVQDSATAVKMLLAGYNIGFGHVEDAICLAEANGENSASWDVISFYLTNLSNPKYFNDTCVKHGYISGIYAVNFANNIAERFEHYKNVIPE